MCRTESVHYEYIVVNEVGKLLGECFTVLSFFSTAETCVFKNNYLAVLHFCNCLLCVLAYYCIVLSENNLCINELCKSFSSSLERELILRTVLRLAEM